MPGRLRGDIEERRARVASLMLARRSIRQMARELGAGRTAIAHDTQVIREEWHRQRMEAIDTAVDEELQRLRALEDAYWDLAITPSAETFEINVQALDRVLKVMERRAKLLGLDAPKKIDITGKLRELVAEAGLSEEDASAAIREAMAIVGEADR